MVSELAISKILSNLSENGQTLQNHREVMGRGAHKSRSQVLGAGYIQKSKSREDVTVCAQLGTENSCDIV